MELGFFKKVGKSKREELGVNNELKRKDSEVTKPEVEVEVESIRVGQRTDVQNAYALILKEKHGNRYLSILVGQAEADAIAVKLHNIELPGPLTHDFLCSIISTLGAKVNNVVINKYVNIGYFLGKARFEFRGQLIEVDCRPSDAVALAIRAMVPIFATEDILNKFSFVI